MFLPQTTKNIQKNFLLAFMRTAPHNDDFVIGYSAFFFYSASYFPVYIKITLMIFKRAYHLYFFRFCPYSYKSLSVSLCLDYKPGKKRKDFSHQRFYYSECNR